MKTHPELMTIYRKNADPIEILGTLDYELADGFFWVTNGKESYWVPTADIALVWVELK